MRPDAGIVIAPPAAAMEPAPPALPAWACPDGWRVVTTEDRPDRCEPWPESGRAACTGASAHFPGEPGCATVGAPCPPGPFAEGLPATGVVYVDDSGSGGDGSVGAPFGRLADALTAVTSGDTIALSKGDHVGDLVIPAGVTVRGACADETRVSSGTTAGDDGILRTTAAGVVVRDVHLTAAAQPGFSVTGGMAELQGVFISNTESRGVMVTGAGTISLRDVVIRGVTSRASDGRGGQGLLIQAGSSATLRRVAVSECQGAGAAVFDADSALDAQDLAIHTVRGITADGAGGSGIFGVIMTTTTGARVVIEDTRSAAVGAFTNSTVTLEDAVIRQTGPADPGAAGGRFGRALVAEGGSTSTLRRGYVEDARDIGAVASGNDSRIVLEDVSLTNVQEEESTGAPGRCALAQGGGTVETRRVHLSTCFGQGLSVIGFRSGGVIEDTTITDIQAQRPSGELGYGLSVQAGATVTLSRVRVDGAHDIGMTIMDEATVTGSDVTVRDVRAGMASVAGGRGLEIDQASTVTLDRLLVEESRDLGLFVAGAGTTVALTSVIVRDTLGQEDGTRGRGVSLQAGASGSIRALQVDRARGGGIVVDGGDLPTDFELEDVVVRDVVADSDNGAGLTVVGAATTVDVRRMVIERVPLAGVLVGFAATLIAEDVTVDDVAADSVGEFGRGINLQMGAQAAFSRVLVDRSKELGLYAGGPGTLLTVEDFVVRETTSRTSDGRYGRGASIEAGGALVARRGRFEDSQDTGVAALAGSSATLEDVQILRVTPRSCVAAACSGDGAGHGVAVSSASTVTVTNFVISEAALCGLMLAQGGEADLMSGEVRASTIGVCIQTDDFDIGRLMDEVSYSDNGANLNSTSLPVPEGSSPLEPSAMD